MRLWDRKALVVIDIASRLGQGLPPGKVPALSVPCGKDGFDIHFDVHKDLTGKPNRAAIRIYNLNEDHRNALSERANKGPVRVRLDAGYMDGMARIYEGDLRILYHDRDATGSFTTVVESGDGEALVSSARVSKSWGPGTPVSKVLEDVGEAFGIGKGNLVTTVGGALLKGAGPMFAGGTAVSGRIFPEFTNLCRSAGLEWSIQDGALQVLPQDKALDRTAVLLTEKTGMEGSPKETRTKKHGRVLRVKCRMIPDIFPGRKIQLEDRTVWRVSKAHYQGETKGDTWDINIEATPLGVEPLHTSLTFGPIEVR